MTYTNEEYAEMAIKANKEGKILKKVDGTLVLVDPEPIHLSDEQIIAQNQLLKESLLKYSGVEIEILNDKIELNCATKEDFNLLKKWKLYRITLSGLDISDINVIFPQKPS